MIIEAHHKIYDSSCLLVVFSSPRQRARYNGSSLLGLRSGGNDWYLYQPPIAGIDYDTETQKLDGIKRIEGVYVVEGVIGIPEAELAQREVAKIDAELVQLDTKGTRGVEDLVEYLVAQGKISIIPPELSVTVARKKELRAARLVLTDGVVTEEEAISLGTTTAGFWDWLKGLFV